VGGTPTSNQSKDGKEYPGVVLKQVLNVTSPVPHQVEAIMIEVVLPPGDLGLKPHSHPGPATAYVLEGEFLMQVKNGPITIYKAGQAFTEKDGDIHIWGANALKDKTTRVLVTLWGRPGEELITFVEEERATFDEAMKMAERKV